MHNAIHISDKFYLQATCLKSNDGESKSNPFLWVFSLFCWFPLLWVCEALGEGEVRIASIHASVGSISFLRWNLGQPWCSLFTHPIVLGSLLFYYIMQPINSSMAKSKVSTQKSVSTQLPDNGFLTLLHHSLSST